jgi:hypothetical protein
MTFLATEGKRSQVRPERGVAPTIDWKKTLSAALRDLQIIPEGFNGRLTLTFKEGGISYLEKTETLK